MSFRDGKGCEARFFEAFSGDYPKPYWLIHIEQAPPHLDVYGVDAVAMVKYPANAGTFRVPVQIKGDWSKVSEYYALHPDAFRARVVVIVVWRSDSFTFIRELLCQEITARRAANIRFDAYLDALERRPIFGSAKRLCSTISERRLQQATPRVT